MDLITLVIDRTTMGMGGIESVYADLIRHAISKGYRVVWLTTEKHRCASSFKEVTEAVEVEKAYIRRSPFGPIYPKVVFSSNERVYILTNDPVRYVICERWARLNIDTEEKNNILILPHYTGPAIFPEQIFRNRFLKCYWTKKLGRLIEKIDASGKLLGFASIHLDACQKSYGVFIDMKEDKVLPGMSEEGEPSDEELMRRAEKRHREFRIITCSRFDFPHKGYLIGMVKAFQSIHNEFPFTKLVIVGYGPGEDKLKQEIGNLTEDCRSAVVMTGPLDKKSLKDLMKTCSLNIGVAGALLDGAECALPCIVMRHYTFDFEGYGLFSEIGEHISSEPGEGEDHLVKSIIRMEDAEYVELCKRSHRKLRETIKTDPDYLFTRIYKKNGKLPINIAEARLLYFQRLALQKFCRRYMYGEEEHA